MEQLDLFIPVINRELKEADIPGEPEIIHIDYVHRAATLLLDERQTPGVIQPKDPDGLLDFEDVFNETVAGPIIDVVQDITGLDDLSLKW